MSTNDPPGLDPDGGDDSTEMGASGPHLASNPTSSRSQVAEMDDLTERFSQQQVMISQLKDLVMAEEAARNQKIASSRLKMEKCVSQLARIRDRAKGSRLRNVSDTPDSIARSSQSMSVEPDDSPLASPQTSSSIVTCTTTTVTTSNVTSVSSVPVKSEESSKLKTPRREVTKMLHQQIQGHKAKIAKTAQHEKELEEALAKIQKQLEENQSQSAQILQLGQSKPKITLPPFVLDDSSESNKTINELKSRITQLEGTILDLQETCKEKDSVIDSKTKAITLMSADLSKKGKNTLDLLDDTKEQMQEMQQNFATMESKMNEEKQKLKDELETCKNRIFYLEEANSILETERFNLSVQNTFLEEQLAEKEKEINKMTEEMVENMKNIAELTLKVDKSVETSPAPEEKGIAEISQMNALSEKIELLEKLNLTLRQSNIEMQEKISSSSFAVVKETSKQTKEESPKPSRRGKAATKAKGSQKYKFVYPKTEPVTPDKPSSNEMQDTIDRLQCVIETLNKQVLEKEVLLLRKEEERKELKEISLDSSLDTSQSEPLPESNESQITASDLSIGAEEKSDIAHDVSDREDTHAKNIEAQLKDAEKKIEKLKAQLSEVNKNMIKVRAMHKKEVKQMQKTIDEFSKVSDSNSEVVKLQTEVSMLTQKIAELEDEKGNLQLHLVDYDSGRVSDSQLHAKLMESESLAEERLKAIAELETQKFDLVQDLHSTKQQLIALEDKVADLSYLENEHVSNELKSAQLEEQLDLLDDKNKEAIEEIDRLKAEKHSILETIELLNKEKAELNNKLEMYIQENMDLIEKLDKLSAEKVSSAESIEMVESLTSQEKMEIDHYQKGIDEVHDDKLKTRDEVEDSLRRNSFSHSTNVETTDSDVPSKIDIINNERRELIEKLDSLKVENSAMSLKLEELLNSKKTLEDRIECLEGETNKALIELKEEKSNSSRLSSEIEALLFENTKLNEQVKSLSLTAEKRPEEDIVSGGGDVESVICKDVVQSVTSPQKEAGTNKASAKSNKNHIKEIFRLKEIVKQRDEEIENLKNQLTSATQESSGDNITLKDELEKAIHDNTLLSDEISQLKHEKDLFNQQLIDMEDSSAHAFSDMVTIKDGIINELEIKVNKNEGIIANLNVTIGQHKSDMDVLNNIMQSKDDEIAQLKDDFEQLDAVSRKLKSTLSQIEDEKSASINNVDKIRELENSLSKYKATIREHEAKIKDLELKAEESLDHVEMLKAEISQYESKINERNKEMDDTNLEIKALNSEKEEILKEIARWKEDCAAKDEEINEIKLQFRKESIAHDEVINKLSNLEDINRKLNENLNEMEKTCNSYRADASKLKEDYDVLDKKSKEQFEKLKKFAANFKKKSALCTELEAQVEASKSKVLGLSAQLDEASMKYQHAFQELSLMNSQYGIVQSQLQQSSSDNETKEMLEKQVDVMQNQLYDLQSQLKQYEITIETLNAEKIQSSQNKSESDSKISALTEENMSLAQNIQFLQDDLKIKANEITKLNNLEKELQEKHNTITNLTQLIEETKDLYNQVKCGQEAKLLEKDIYIESLESEISKHKDRIHRLEDSVSTMEERRASLERKTDNLVTKLNEKDAEYSESSMHEDELEKRLAALIKHDELIQKQLEDAQQENVDLSDKLSNLLNSNTLMRSELDSTRAEVAKLGDSAAHLHALEEERHSLNERISFLESEIKRITSESSEILKQKSKEYEFLESELHSLMSNTEIQRRLSREEIEKLQDQMTMQTNFLKDLQQENEWLKAENETLNLQKIKQSAQQEPVPHFDFVQFDESKSSSDYETKISQLAHLLEEKDKEINTLSIQLQLASSAATPDAFPADSANKIKDFESVIRQKDLEIERIDLQFKACLSQLSDAIESEQALKQTVADLTKEINSQVDIVHRLESEIAKFSVAKAEYKDIEAVVEPFYQSKAVEVQAVSKNVDVSDKPSTFDSEALKSLEEQIVPDDSQFEKVVLSEVEMKMVRNFEHDAPEPVPVDLKSYFQSSGPVDEDFIQPKKTYVCQRGETDETPIQPLVENPFDEEDGWGWGNEETMVQQEHTHSRDDANQLKMKELEILIQTLTDEKNKVAADLTQSQQKTTKALLKLKEFKNKNDALTNEIKNLKMTSDFNMLDVTIQDELASQIKALEEKLKEITNEADKDKLEKDNLLKRIDVLTSANERLTEMKEKQDIEMQICRNQNKGLSEKIKNLEWDNSFGDHIESPIVREEEIEIVSEPQDVANAKDMIELIKKIQDLEADNEELQAFIEDQQTKLNLLKNVEVEYEKFKNHHSYELNELKEENETLKQKLNDLNNKCDNFESTIRQMSIDSNRKEEINVETDNLKSEIKDLQEKLTNLTIDLKTKIDSLKHFDELKIQNEQLQIKFDDLEKIYNSLQNEMQSLRAQQNEQMNGVQFENDCLRQEIKEQSMKVDELESKLNMSENEKVYLKRELEDALNKTRSHSENEVVDLTAKLEALVKEYYEFQEKFNEMAAEKDKIDINYNDLLIEKNKMDLLYQDVAEQEAASKTELIKLSYEKDELAEKYDKLLNKLNEKNLNEASEQTILFTDKLNNLTQELSTKNMEIIQLNEKVEQLQSERLSFELAISKLQEDNNELINNLNVLRNSINEAVDQRGMEVAEVWKQHLAMREAEFLNLEQALRQEMKILKQQTVNNENVKFAEPLSASNDDKISKYERQLENATKSLTEFKQQLEYVTSEKDNQKEFYEANIFSLQAKYNEIQKELSEEKSQNVDNTNKIISLREELKCLQNITLLNETKGDDHAKLLAAKDEEMRESAIRIHQLSETFNVKINDYEIALTNKESELDNVRQQLYITENKLSDNAHEHEAELADMRLKLHAERTQYDQFITELNDKIEKLELQLETKINECKNLNIKIETMIQNENARLNELKKALESQEIEIVTLKENLTEQADTYEKLVISHMQEIHKLKSNRHVTFSEETKPGAEIEPSTSTETKEENPARAEFDLALYMLHQRDVRCEELTVELTQLLEERDTLQLKLSNTLRANEELRSRISSTDLEAVEATEEIVKTDVPDLGKSPSGSDPIETPTTSKQAAESSPSDKSLESKLSQLHKVGHMRDVRLRDEREHRMRQMELLQRDLQHLPPEAAARLREAHYTLTRDTQSTSTVLLNWLWGKTTPKVVHM